MHVNVSDTWTCPHVRSPPARPYPSLWKKEGGRGWLCQHQDPSLASLEVLAFWEYPVPTALTARLARRLNRGLVGIIPFPGQSNGWMRDLLHEERYGRRWYHHDLSFRTAGDA